MATGFGFNAGTRESTKSVQNVVSWDTLELNAPTSWKMLNSSYIGRGKESKTSSMSLMGLTLLNHILSTRFGLSIIDCFEEILRSGLAHSNATRVTGIDNINREGLHHHNPTCKVSWMLWNRTCKDPTVKAPTRPKKCHFILKEPKAHTNIHHTPRIQPRLTTVPNPLPQTTQTYTGFGLKMRARS